MEILHQVLQQLINGISLGSIYALIALGYTMIYGIIKLINFAHGDIYMVGAYIGFFAITQAHLSIVPSLLISLVVTGFLGMLVERLAYKPLRHAPRIRFAPIQQKLGDIAGQARAQRDQPFAVLLQQIIIHARAIIKTARPARADQRGQVLIARLIFAQQYQMAVIAGNAGFVIHIGADVNLAPDYRMDALRLAGAIKIQHAVHHAVIRNRAAGHAQFLQAGNQPPDSARAVQQRIFRMQMQMRKHAHRAPNPRKFPILL